MARRGRLTDAERARRVRAREREKEQRRLRKERERRARAVAHERERERVRRAKAKARLEAEAIARKMELRESREAKRLLERLLKDEPSAAALARKVGVSPSTLRRWRTMAVTPPNAGTMLLIYQATLREQKKARKVERDVFAELLRLSGQKGKLPNIRTSEGVRSGKQIKGYRWTKRVERELSRDVLDQIVDWLEGLRAKSPEFNLWQFVLVTSQYALNSRTPFEHASTETSEASYKTVEYMVQVAHPETGNLVVNMPVSTPRGPRSQLIAQLKRKLDKILREGMVRVFVHAVNAFNYRLRTDKERRAYETAQRRERERDLKKRRKKR